MKFNLNYNIKIILPNPNAFKLVGKTLTQLPKENPFRQIEFSGNDLTFKANINRNVFVETNEAEFYLYNLSQDTRTQLHQDKLLLEPAISKYIEIEAGYGEDLHNIFSGYITYLSSSKDNTEYITTIKAVDRALELYRNVVSATIDRDSPAHIILTKLFENVRGLTPQTSEIVKTDVLPRGQVLFGDPADILDEEFEGKYYVDGDKVYFTNNNTIQVKLVATIKAETGVLSTPDLNGNFIEVDVVFEPKLAIGQFVNLVTKHSLSISGKYRLEGYKHKLVISKREKGKNITSVVLNRGTIL